MYKGNPYEEPLFIREAFAKQPYVLRNSSLEASIHKGHPHEKLYL